MFHVDFRYGLCANIRVEIPQFFWEGACMRRREFLAGAASSTLATAVALAADEEQSLEIGRDILVIAEPDADVPTIAEREILKREVLEFFPFEMIEVPWNAAVKEWRERQSTQNWAVLIGDPLLVVDLAEPFRRYDTHAARLQKLMDILRRAELIRLEEDLLALREAEKPKFLKHIDKTPLLSSLLNDPLAIFSVPMGEWPEEDSKPSPESATPDRLRLQEIRADKKIGVVLIPTNDWTTVPAHLQFGGWEEVTLFNQCPAPEIHVAAFRSWRDRFGARLVGLQRLGRKHGRVSLEVSRPPQTRTEALDLARQHHLYCLSSVHELAPYAASLMAQDKWTFQW